MLNFLINFTQTYNLNPINTNLISDSYSYVNSILIIFILISLVFTFHSKGTTVHKVLGLLLLSIFVVFLWILQTQFLFIYLVYILAFISAVLMLFLSVVLMLPISTFNQSTTLFKNLSLFGTALIFEEIIVLKFILLSTFFFIIIYILLKTKKLNFYEVNLQKLIKKLKPKLSVKKSLTNIYLINIRYLYYINKISLPNYLKISIFLLTIKYYFNLVINYVNNLFIIIVETLTQIILYCSLFLIFLVPMTIKQTWFTNILDINFDISLGLGQLKSLLYGDFSLFLLFSTVVLLVSLFGAAIMTRTEK